MDEFQLKSIDEITVVKVELVIATLRDVQPLSEVFKNNSLFNREKVIIDLSQCNYVDSTFIGMVIRIFKKLAENNCKVKLVYPQLDRVESFWTMGVAKVIECYNTLPEAVDSFRPDLPIQDDNQKQVFSINKI